MILHFLLGLSAAANAASYNIPPFPDMIAETPLIVHGTISDTHVENSIASDGSRIIYTFYSLNAKEILKGSESRNPITIRQTGGTKDGYNLEVTGFADLKDGEDTILMLGPANDDGSRSILNMELGKYTAEDKDGQTILKGGVFEFIHNHGASGDVPEENKHVWTTKEVKEVAAKQAAEKATKANPLLAGSPASNSRLDNTSPENHPTTQAQAEAHSSDASHLRNPEERAISFAYFAFGIAAAMLGAFFYFRKR